MTHYFANVLYLSICFLGNCSCFYFRLLTFFKIKFLKVKHPGPPSECQTVWIQIKTVIMLAFIWVQTVCKRLLADDKLSTGMQRAITDKYFSVKFIASYRDIHAHVYHKYSDTLNTFNVLCPLNKAKVILKKSSLNQFYFPMLNGTLSFLQKYLFLLLSFQFCIIYGTCSKKMYR